MSRKRMYVVLGALVGAVAVVVLVLAIVPLSSTTTTFTRTVSASNSTVGGTNPPAGAFNFSSPWNSQVHVSWTSPPETFSVTILCIPPSGSVLNVTGNDGNLSFTSTGGTTSCGILYFGTSPDRVTITVTIVRPLL